MVVLLRGQSRINMPASCRHQYHEPPGRFRHTPRDLFRAIADLMTEILAQHSTSRSGSRASSSHWPGSGCRREPEHRVHGRCSRRWSAPAWRLAWTAGRRPGRV